MMFKIISKIIKIGVVSEKNQAVEGFFSPEEYQKKILKKFHRSLAIRHVDAGSCNGCELEIHALNNPFYNLSQYGVEFVASPRHADLLLVTGPVTKNMKEALVRTYEAMPNPKWVVALGSCACSNPYFGDSYAIAGKVEDVIPVSIRVPGCPPSPDAILQAILNLVA